MWVSSSVRPLLLYLSPALAVFHVYKNSLSGVRTHLHIYACLSITASCVLSSLSICLPLSYSISTSLKQHTHAPQQSFVILLYACLFTPAHIPLFSPQSIFFSLFSHIYTDFTGSPQRHTHTRTPTHSPQQPLFPSSTTLLIATRDAVLSRGIGFEFIAPHGFAFVPYRRPLPSLHLLRVLYKC